MTALTQCCLEVLAYLSLILSHRLYSKLMDRASQVLAQGVPFGVPKSYRALADHRGVPRSTLHHRARGRRSLEQKAKSQQYLTPWEESAFVKFLLQASDFGQTVQMKYIASLAFSLTKNDPCQTDHQSLQAETGQRLWSGAIRSSKQEEFDH